MRELKFRAWDTLQSLMILPDYADWEDFFIEPNGDVFVSYDSSTNWSSYRDRRKVDLVIMQYTGLKDKNGNDIYEGDLVSLNKKIGKVYYGAAMFFLKINSEDDSRSLSHVRNEPLEVIGNIYQNPDLL
jgi:uncharacterized phage protein (TIGR01671 family)